VRKIIRNEGVRGVYRGLGPNLVVITPEKAIKLAVNDFVRERLAIRHHLTPSTLSAFDGMVAGATAGFCQVIATNPMEIVKIRLQVSALEYPDPTLRPNAIAVVRNLGISGLYRGTPATLLRDVPFSIIFFSTACKVETTRGERGRGRGAILGSVLGRDCGGSGGGSSRDTGRCDQDEATGARRRVCGSVAVRKAGCKGRRMGSVVERRRMESGDNIAIICHCTVNV